MCYDGEFPSVAHFLPRYVRIITINHLSLSCFQSIVAINGASKLLHASMEAPCMSMPLK